MFDRLPTPYGLVRFGVAPDHPKIKSVIRVYEKTAARPEFRFFGNVEVGKDVTVDELRERYHAVVFAYGTATDRQLGIPGEDLPGTPSGHRVRQLVQRPPRFADREFDLSCERVVVIGNGNVAADVARMLALTRDELAETDTADHAIEAFSGSNVKEILVLGRRGPAQAAFTNPEVRELGEMVERRHRHRRARDGARRDQPRVARLRRRRPDQPPQRRDLHRVLLPRAGGQAAEDRPPLPPLAHRDPGRRQGRADRGREERAAARARTAASARSTPASARRSSAAWCCARSATRASRSRASPSTSGRGLIHNEAGRVHDGEGNQVPGLYAVGWIKRGPSGVIGTNKKDAQETVDELFADLEAGKVPEAELAGDRGSIEALLNERKPDHVTFEGWQAIDAAEVEAGKPHGRPRVKFCRTDEMVEASKAAKTAA